MGMHVQVAKAAMRVRGFTSTFSSPESLSILLLGMLSVIPLDEISAEVVRKIGVINLLYHSTSPLEPSSIL